MNISLTPAPYPGAPVIVMIAGLGGNGSYWLTQREALSARYQVVCYDQCGTGNNPATLPDNYQISDMAGELQSALQQAGILRFCVVGHALGALVGMQLALDYPQSVSALVLVNGWLSLDTHTRRCFHIRERLLQAGGPPAWVEAQPLFLYPADWLSAHAPRLEAEEALALAHFQGEHNLQRRLQALKEADFSATARQIRAPALIICSQDDMLVPCTCSQALHQALVNSIRVVMARGGHACNVTESDEFNGLLLEGLARVLPATAAVQKEYL
ncbi:pyrimidine utilization protein D [Yokenella regensburgei]|uniref:pyrimidine utilization protein D n=1 Tax=Yokenella regensburgei TaxID=158877 RepID=UPI003F171BA3